MFKFLKEKLNGVVKKFSKEVEEEAEVIETPVKEVKKEHSKKEKPIKKEPSKKVIREEPAKVKEKKIKPEKNELSITIKKPVSLVFEYITNPDNTPLWISSIKKEERNETPPKKGTIYKNVDTHDTWTEYEVAHIKKNEAFELKSNSYHVQYIFEEISKNETKLNYVEWDDSGKLKKVFKQSFLNKLKELLETKEQETPDEEKSLTEKKPSEPSEEKPEKQFEEATLKEEKPVEHKQSFFSKIFHKKEAEENK